MQACKHTRRIIVEQKMTLCNKKRTFRLYVGETLHFDHNFHATVIDNERDNSEYECLMNNLTKQHYINKMKK